MTDLATNVACTVTGAIHMPLRFVSYIRVSTARQGRSGLGIEAQREAIRQHIKSSDGEHVSEFIEIESGRRSDRSELAKALSACRAQRCTLIIAKIDRLSRSLSFVSALMDSGVDFVATDNPAANRLTLHVLAAVAENEARQISERTKVALAAAKRRGVQLGGFRGRVATDADRQRAAAAKTALADARARDLASTFDALKAEGITSYRALAVRLNAMKIPTTGSADASGRPIGNGGCWHAAQVRRLLARIAALYASAPSIKCQAS